MGIGPALVDGVGVGGGRLGTGVPSGVGVGAMLGSAVGVAVAVGCAVDTGVTVGVAVLVGCGVAVATGASSPLPQALNSSALHSTQIRNRVMRGI